MGDLLFVERVGALAYLALHFLLPVLRLAEKSNHPQGNHFFSRPKSFFYNVNGKLFMRRRVTEPVEA
jgi:hypothetical protein